MKHVFRTRIILLVETFHYFCTNDLFRIEYLATSKCIRVIIFVYKAQIQQLAFKFTYDTTSCKVQ